MLLAGWALSPPISDWEKLVHTALYIEVGSNHFDSVQSYTFALKVLKLDKNYVLLHDHRYKLWKYPQPFQSLYKFQDFLRREFWI